MEPVSWDLNNFATNKKVIEWLVAYWVLEHEEHHGMLGRVEI